MSTLYVCGASNPEGVRLALRVNGAHECWDRIVLLDDDKRRHGQAVLGIPVLGSFDLLWSADPTMDAAVNFVARTTHKRAAAELRIAAFGVRLTGLVHPDVDVDGADLAPDVLIYPHATIGPEALIGKGSVVFMGAVVGHGSTVGAHCVMAPNAVLNARVIAGDRVYVGTNASVLPDLRIGDDVTIAANSAVMRSVPARTTVIGVPAKSLPSLSPRRSSDAATSVAATTQ